MKHPKIVLVLLLSVLTVLALNAGGCDTGEPPIYRNTSSPIYVGINDEFVIALEANHTTGYSWQLAEEVDENILSLESVEYEAGDTEVVGAPGEEKWTFKAKGARPDRADVQVRAPVGGRRNREPNPPPPRLTLRPLRPTTETATDTTDRRDHHHPR